MTTPPSEPHSPIFQAITEAALDLLESDGTVDYDTLLARFPGEEAEVRACVEALADYETQVHGGRRTKRPLHARELSPGSVVGDFEIVELLGRGGMGIVYRARQRSLGGRAVALKMLPSELVAKDPRFLERFRREVQLAAGLEAPGVARVFGSGEEGGQPYFAMELVPGPSLADVLRELAARRAAGDPGIEARSYVRQVARIGCAIARALGSLHEAGLVHRDIKPSNVILVPEHGATLTPARARTLAEPPRRPVEECLAGRPVLVDFGLLRPVEASHLTQSRTLIGTPAFASPEASLGRDVDARSDVFSLGALLHDLASATATGGRQPATAGLHDLRVLNPGVDARFAAILKMCTEERPDLRYAHGSEVAEELARYLAERPVRALPTNGWQRVRLWMRREPAQATKVAAGIAAAFMVLLGVVFGGTSVAQARDALEKARQHQARGELQEAAAAWRAVHAARGLLWWQPGASADLAFASHVVAHEEEARALDLLGLGPGGDPKALGIEPSRLPIDPDGKTGRCARPLAEVYTLIDQGSRGEFEETHHRVLQLLLTTRNGGLEVELAEEQQVVLYAFLARELGGDRAPWRQQLASISAAQISVCAPRFLGLGEELSAGRLELAESLFERVVSSDEIKTRRHALSAISGMASDAMLSRLLDVDLGDDIELKRLFNRTFQRVHYGRRMSLEFLPVELMAAWGAWAYEQLLAVSSYDPRRLQQIPVEVFVEGHTMVVRQGATEIGPAYFEVVLAVALELEQLRHDSDEFAYPLPQMSAPERSTRAERLEQAMQWTSEHPLAQDIWLDKRRQLRADREGTAYSGRPFFARLLAEPSLSGVTHEQLLAELRTDNTLHDTRPFVARVEIGRDRHHTYANIWDRSLIPDRPLLPRWKPKPAAKDWDHSGALSFSEGGAVLEGSAKSARFVGCSLKSETPGKYHRTFWLSTLAAPLLAHLHRESRLRVALGEFFRRLETYYATTGSDWFVELTDPLEGFVEVTFALPEQPVGGILMVDHHLSGRVILPFAGTSATRVSLNGVSAWTTVDAGAKRVAYLSPLGRWWALRRHVVHASDIAGQDELVVRFEIVGGTNLEALRSIRLVMQALDDSGS